MEQDNVCISWESLPWVLFEKKVFHLQCKIYEAKKSDNIKLVKRLQKLLIHSKSSHFIATKVLVNSFENYKLSEHEQLTLADSIKDSLKENWFLNKFRLSPSYRNLDFGKTLVLQCVLRLALEPLYFEKSNWILWKKGEGTFKFLKKIRSHIERVSKLGRTKILRFEISTCLRNVKYNAIMKQFTLPFKYKLFIYKNLLMYSSIVENSLVSFLMRVLINKTNNFYFGCKDSLVWRNNFNFGNFSFMYSNSIVYFLRSKDNFYDFVDKLKNFLSNNGLLLNLSSIQISTLDEGFDFFGWFFKKRISKKIFISPSCGSWIQDKKLFKSILNGNNSSDLKIRKMALLKNEWMSRYGHIPKSVVRSKFYFVKKSIYRYCKILKCPQKKILFESFRFKIF